MKRMILRLLPVTLLIVGAPLPGAPVSEQLRERIIADARGMPATAVKFVRTTKSVRSGGGSVTKIDKTERWDGRRWTLLAVDGQKPTAEQRQEAEKLAATMPVPGYHRMAELIAAATDSDTDAQGRTVLKIPKLPAGSVRTDSADISSHLQAELTLALRDGVPWVERVKVTARESFRMNLLIKVSSFEQVSEYRLDGSGKPKLSSQSADSAGTMFGFPGGEKSVVTYVYR